MNTKKRGIQPVSSVAKPGSHDALEELRRLGPSPGFGELVKSIRICDEITQTELAAKLDISKQHLSAIENGKKTVSVARAARFAEALGYPQELFVVAVIEDELRDAGLDLHFDLMKALSE
jgi:transcriptional regulator with XRE-family HTH domain